MVTEFTERCLDILKFSFHSLSTASPCCTLFHQTFDLPGLVQNFRPVVCCLFALQIICLLVIRVRAWCFLRKSLNIENCNWIIFVSPIIIERKICTTFFASIFCFGWLLQKVRQNSFQKFRTKPPQLKTRFWSKKRIGFIRSHEHKSNRVRFISPSEQSDFAPQKRYLLYQIGSPPCEQNAHLVWKVIWYKVNPVSCEHSLNDVWYSLSYYSVMT